MNLWRGGAALALTLLVGAPLLLPLLGTARVGIGAWTSADFARLVHLYSNTLLLIAGVLDKHQLTDFRQLANSLGLDALTEVHSEAEADMVAESGAKIIGINNRNLETFVTDIETSKRLIEFLPADKPVISESGISCTETIITLHDLGFKGFLIGETFMKAPKPAIAFAEFMKALRASMKKAEGV